MTKIEDFAPHTPGFLKNALNAVAIAVAFTGKLAKRSASIFGTWAQRHRDRQQVLDLLAQDHRTAADMGTTEEDLKAEAHKPFWRP